VCPIPVNGKKGKKILVSSRLFLIGGPVRGEKKKDRQLLAGRGRKKKGHLTCRFPWRKRKKKSRGTGLGLSHGQKKKEKSRLQIRRAGVLERAGRTGAGGKGKKGRGVSEKGC